MSSETGGGDVGRRDVFCVIRAAGERTADMARQLLEAQVGHSSVAVVREVPFSAAVEATFRAGIEAGARWTIAVDADILVRPSAVGTLVAAAEASPDGFFHLQGQVLDRSFRIPRPGCPRVYRTSMLPRALSVLAAAVGEARPESQVSSQMAAEGAASLSIPDVLGLHDYEQSYSDLFRKGAFHTRKHQRRMPYSRVMWRRLSRSEPDYRALLAGAEYADSPDRDIGPDIGLFDRREIEQLLAAKGLHEKRELKTARTEVSAVVEAEIAGWRAPAEYRIWQARKLIPSGARRACRGLAAGIAGVGR
ncbi:MAG: hypothetical protein RIE08_07625 [Acidimicrobiales bacterium]